MLIANCLISRRPKSLSKHYGLHAGNLEAFAATHILAGHEIVFAQHVGASFGETSTVALVGAAAGKLPLFGAYHPGDVILGGLVAVGTV
jgi:hypothetical protein